MSKTLALKGSFSLLLLLWSVSGICQSWVLEKQVYVDDIDQMAVDLEGNVLITQRNLGELKKYNPEGELILTYSPVQLSPITAIEIFSKFKILLFYKDLQEYVLLNRYLGAPITYAMAGIDVGYIEEITLNFQQHAWLVDMTDFSLKLIETSSGSLIEDKSLSQILDQGEADIIAFESYQNRLYLVEKKHGVFVFDNIGNFLFNWEMIAGSKIGFYQDDMYFQSGRDLILKSLYTGNEKKRALPEKSYNSVRFIGNRLIGISDNGFDIYQYLSR